MNITSSFSALSRALAEQNISLGELALREQESETGKSRADMAVASATPAVDTSA